MSDEQIALARLGSILEDVYKKYRDEGTMPNDRKQYFSGFADALMTLGLLNQPQLEALVEDTNMKVFNMTLKERREVLDIKADPSMFDSPAWVRQGKTIRFWLTKKEPGSLYALAYKLCLTFIVIVRPN